MQLILNFHVAIIYATIALNTFLNIIAMQHYQ